MPRPILAALRTTIRPAISKQFRMASSIPVPTDFVSLRFSPLSLACTSFFLAVRCSLEVKADAGGEDADWIRTRTVARYAAVAVEVPR